MIIADSLALPREGVDYDETWPAMLATSIPGFTWINRAIRMSTTERLNGDQGEDCLEFYRPQLVVLQLGICDCAPRVLHRRTAAIVYRLPFKLGARLSSWLERKRGRKVSNCFVSLTSYESNLRAYLARASTLGTLVVAISTLPASRLLRSKNPRVNQQIDAYNATLERLASEFAGFRVVHPFRDHPAIDELFVDGYHINAQGARHIATAVEPLARMSLQGEPIPT